MNRQPAIRFSFRLFLMSIFSLLAITVATGTNNPQATKGFTLVQHVHNTTCASATTCAITLNQSIAAGDLLVFEGSMFPASVMTGTDNGGTFAQCVSCVGFDPTSYLEETSGGWILSAGAEASQITLTFNAAASGEIEMWEYSVTGGTPGFDGANQIETQNSANPTASTFTPSGTNDISVQACRADQLCSSVTPPFSGDNLGNYYAWADLNTPTTWTAPTWTLSGSGTSQLTQMEFGFGVSPCANSTFVDFGGPSGSAVGVPQLVSATHGWQGGYWTINGVGADLTFQTAASQRLQQPTGRLCDGGNYADASTTGLQYSTNDPQTYLQLNSTNGMFTGSSVSAGVWYYSTLPPTVTGETDDIAIFATGGQDFVLLHELNDGGGRLGEVECGSGTSAGFVALSPNTWYWVDLVYNTTGNHTIKIYNNANPPVQIGSTMTCPSRGIYQPAYITVGNVNSDASLPPGYFSYFDGLLISLDGTDPLLPGSAPAAATPTFSLAPGSYSSQQWVTLSDTTPGAVIYYTTDGTTPTTGSLAYNNKPIQVNITTTIQAIAVANNFSNSGVASATYTIVGTPITPWIQVNGHNWQQTNTITVSSGSSVNLGPQPLDNSWSWTGPNGYTSNWRQINNIPLSVGANVYVATYTNYSGAQSVETFTITVTPAIATPAFSPAPGTYSGTQSVTLSDTTTGAVLYYTTDGTTPNTNSSVYNSPIQVNSNTTIQAIAVANGYASVVAKGTYTITNAWQEIGVRFNSIAAGSDGTVLATNSWNQTLWSYASGRWTQLRGQLQQVAVVNQNNIWGIGRDNNVYQFDGRNWTQVGVNANSIAAASDGTVLVTNNRNQSVWKYVSPNNWVSVPGNMKAVAVVANNSYFGIGLDNNVYQFNGNGWTQVGVNVNSIAAGSDGTVLVTNNHDQSIWKYVSPNKWVTVPGNMRSVAVVSNNDYYGIGLNQNAYAWGSYATNNSWGWHGYNPWWGW
jgi:hypothetical protein